MDQWFRLVIFDPFAVAALCAISMLVCLWMGFRQGRRHPEGRSHGSALIDEACLAILGLLLAFCFAAAYGKLDTRDERIVADANALRTLHFRCQSLPQPQREQLQPLVIESVRQRLIISEGKLDAPGLRAMDGRIRVTEGEILALVSRFAQDSQTADLGASLVDACLELVESHEARLAAAMDHIPMSVIALMIFVASISAYLMGRSEAETGRLRRRTVMLILIVSAIVQVTMDLEQPLRGFIQSDQSPIIRLAQNMGVTA